MNQNQQIPMAQPRFNSQCAAIQSSDKEPARLWSSFNPAWLEAIHPLLKQIGERVLATHFFASTDEEHVRYLLELFDPPPTARVLDAGCGIGEVARLMLEDRPDLRFTLANIVLAQLAECPPSMVRLYADCHELPLEDSAFEAVMFNSALCNMNAPRALSEARRVLVEGGRLMVNDWCRTGGDGRLMDELLMATAYHEQELRTLIEGAGFSVVRTERPQRYHQNHLRRICGESEKGQEQFNELFGQVRPIILICQAV